ncbi:MAG TPA: proton-conducting transporter membrane subunit [Elusimicrobiales bacterium]|nr:proton-conducting transporter membrane subunit [Elusimicrobiales bacterium]
MAIATSSTTLSLFIYMEIASVFLYMMFKSSREFENNAKIFVYDRIAGFIFLFAVFYIFHYTGTFRLSQIFWQISNNYLDEKVLFVSSFLILAGILIKTAQFPFCAWVNSVETVRPFSAVFMMFFMSLGVFVFARFYPLLTQADNLLTIMLWLCALTGIVSALGALSSRNIFKILIFSAISQTALSAAALAGGSYWQGIFHLVNHFMFSLLLFLCAGTVVYRCKNTDIKKMGEVRNFMPVTYLTFTFAILAGIGIFPFCGFFSKKEIIFSLYVSGSNVYIPILLAYILNVLYFTRLFVNIFHSKTESAKNAVLKEGHPAMLIVQILLAIVILFSGWMFKYNNIFENLISGTNLGFSKISGLGNVILIFSIFAAFLFILYFYAKKYANVWTSNKKISFNDRFAKSCLGAQVFQNLLTFVFKKIFNFTSFFETALVKLFDVSFSYTERFSEMSTKFVETFGKITSKFTERFYLRSKKVLFNLIGFKT